MPSFRQAHNHHIGGNPVTSEVFPNYLHHLKAFRFRCQFICLSGPMQGFKRYFLASFY